MHQDVDEGDNLTLFLNTLKRFNNDKHLNHDWKIKIEAYFSYRWS